PGVVLLDSAKSSPYTKMYLSEMRPERVQLVGEFPEGRAAVERRLDVTTIQTMAWDHAQPRALWGELFPKADRVVGCPPAPRGLSLQGGCRAAVLGAPLFVAHGTRGEAEDLRRQLDAWDTNWVYAIGEVGKLARGLGKVRVTRLANEQAVAALCRKHL